MSEPAPPAKIECPACRKKIEATPDEDGQISCPECGSYYPLAFARRLAAFEKMRADRKGEDTRDASTAR